MDRRRGDAGEDHGTSATSSDRGPGGTARCGCRVGGVVRVDERSWACVKVGATAIPSRPASPSASTSGTVPTSPAHRRPRGRAGSAAVRARRPGPSRRAGSRGPTAPPARSRAPRHRRRSGRPGRSTRRAAPSPGRPARAWRPPARGSSHGRVSPRGGRGRPGCAAGRGRRRRRRRRGGFGRRTGGGRRGRRKSSPWSVARFDERTGRVEVTLAGEERVFVHAVDLHGYAGRPGPKPLELRDGGTKDSRNRAPWAPARVWVSLCAGRTRGRTRCTPALGEVVCGRRRAAHRRLDRPSVREALLERGERLAVVQVRRVHGVPTGPQVVGERADPVGQPLDVVDQQYLGHVSLHSSIERLSSNDPLI